MQQTWYILPQSLWVHVCIVLAVMTMPCFLGALFSILCDSDNHFASSSKVFPELWWERINGDIPFRMECYTLHIIRLWVSVFVLIYCRRKLLWCYLRETLVYEKSRIRLAVILLLHYFCSSSIWFPWRSLAYMASGSWPPKKCRAWVPHQAVVLKSNQKVVGCPHKLHSAIALVHLACRSPSQTQRFVAGSFFISLLW